jgi:sugar phosphate isomerase/epimerase
MGKIALSTWSLLPVMGYRGAIDFAVAHGFEGVELWSNPIDFWPEAVTADEEEAIRRAARDHHLSLAVHFCYGSNNLADYHDGHRAVCVEQLRETITLASRLGAEIVVIHPGTIPDFLPVHAKDNLNPQLSLVLLKREAIERFRHSLSAAVAWAEERGVTLGLENLGYRQNSIQSTHQDLANWVDEIGSPALRITLDVGHANLEQGLEAAIATLGPRVCHVHLDDNDGKASKHGELGTGSIDWRANAPFLRSFRGMLSLEIRNDEDTEGAVRRSKAFIERVIRTD